MTTYRRLVATFALAAGCAGAAFAAPVHVGAPVDVAAPTSIADILARPADFAGKTVRVEGEVRGVCTRMGCWMDIGDEKGARIRVKVEDGVLVFPSDAVGKPAVAQGAVTVEEMTREQYVSWQKHMAEDAGEPFDEAKVGAGPFTMVQIAGTGADVGE
jgi:hypothetical protein